MALKVATSRWKARVTGYVNYVDREVAMVDEIASVEVGRTLLDLFDDKWEKHTDAYSLLEASFPEPEVLDEDNLQEGELYRSEGSNGHEPRRPTTSATGPSPDG